MINYKRYILDELLGNSSFWNSMYGYRQLNNLFLTRNGKLTEQIANNLRQTSS